MSYTAQCMFLCPAKENANLGTLHESSHLTHLNVVSELLLLGTCKLTATTAATTGGRSPEGRSTPEQVQGRAYDSRTLTCQRKVGLLAGVR